MVKVERISGNIVDLIKDRIYPGTLVIKGGSIVDIIEEEHEYGNYLIPGLVDAHIHIESSMLVPAEFAGMAVVHGTVAVVSDPHEIANVLGIKGIRYMINNGIKVPFKFYFGAPACVPATEFETAGAELNAARIEALFKRDGLRFLCEVMNYPDVLKGDPGVMAKIEMAQKYHKPIDGHAPGLSGQDLKTYLQTGIGTDHEAFQFEEGLEKIEAGMRILIREGTAAKNFNQLQALIPRYPDHCMFCCDDKHPDDLLKGHINDLVKKALRNGYDKMQVLKCATLNPVQHYGLEVGLLQKGDPADVVVIDDFERFRILETYINGVMVAKDGEHFIPKVKSHIINNFKVKPKRPVDFRIKADQTEIDVIEVIDGELVTGWLKTEPKVEEGYIISDPERDLLKITVVNRYREVSPAVGFIKNFGLQKGAIASSVAHDSHNIVAVGVSDEDLARAVNLIIRHKGGLGVVGDGREEILPLPVAGLMSTEDGYKVAKDYQRIAARAKELGSKLKDPFMTMSFMTLLVIPELKISDRGLFDGKNFRPIIKY
ncbi:MAG: adenine deaminase [Bacteroidota bacterium]